MKQRLLVMNGQRIVQNEHGGKWITEFVDKAGTLKPGIYNLFVAVQADKTKVHAGLVVHLDKKHVFQQSGASYVKHTLADFAKLPAIGDSTSIKYTNGSAEVSQAATLKRGRRIS